MSPEMWTWVPDVALFGLIVSLVWTFVSGALAPRRELEVVRTFREQLEESDRDLNHFAAAVSMSLAVISEPVIDYEVVTQAAALQWLPPWVAQEFDCPTGAHAWVGIHEFRWCQHCPARRRTPCPDTERPALDVIYDLQFGRSR